MLASVAVLLPPGMGWAAVPAAVGTGGSAGWPTYGGDAGGQRFSTDATINTGTVGGLRQAWVAHTGAMGDHRAWQERASFEATPILFGDLLYLSTPFDQVLALDPETGAVRWRYDPHVGNPPRGIITSRGVGAWSGGAAGGMCARRIFLGTLDARMLAMDAATGKPCEDFGAHGSVDLTKGTGYVAGDEYQITSAPTVVGDVVITGSSIGDNRRVDVERGVVRGLDARTGRQLWSWDPIPWAERAKLRTGGGNAWSTIAADAERGIVYVPTSSPSPDFYGVNRLGDDRDADSLVALDARTGRKLWSFQAVHHNLWDYDIAAEPLLFDYRGRPAVALATKMGTVFVLDRVTGAPLAPVTERAVPQTDVPGEKSWATQPQSALPALVPDRLTAVEAWGPTEADRLFCHDKIAALRNEGMFTPPSLHGSLLYPGSLGGVNWGSMAIDPRTGMLYANTNRLAFLVRLAPREETWWHQNVSWPMVLWMHQVKTAWIRNSWPFRQVMSLFFPDEGFQTNPEKTIDTPHFGKEWSASLGTPYISVREPLLSPSGLPCNPPPWGAVVALDLNRGAIAWQKPLGQMTPQVEGSTNLGGPIATAGGLLFSAAGRDPHLRAFDSASGRLLWTGDLPVPAQATPMMYSFHGHPYLVIAAGGHGSFGTAQGDSVVAFSLGQPGK